MRRSKVARLPFEVRAAIESAWREGRLTIDQIMDFVRSRGADVASDPEHGVSRSGLHRYLQSMDEVAGRMRDAEAMAGAVVGKLGEPGSGNMRRLLTQLLSQVAMYQLRSLENDGEKVKPADLMFLAKAIRDIEGAFKTGADAELKIRKEFAASVEKKVEAAARVSGLDPQVLERAKELVRGALE